MQKILTFSRNAEAMPGNVLANSCPLKNASRISGQPGERTIAKPRPVKTTAVEASAIAAARPAP
jgi:hypothetical protein